MSENLLGLTFFFVFFFPLFLLFFIFYLSEEKKRSLKLSKHSFNKNFFDWIVYILAWITAPFLFFFAILDTAFEEKFGNHPVKFYKVKITGCNWEDRRRKNLYVFICVFTIFMIFYLLNVVLGVHLLKIETTSLLFFILFITSFVFSYIAIPYLWKLLNRYEEYIESKSYIPDSAKIKTLAGISKRPTPTIKAQKPLKRRKL